MRHRHTRRNGPHLTTEAAIADLTGKIAHNLGVDAERIRYGKLGHQGKLGTDDPHWTILYRGQWRELPWHFDGPTGVTQELLQRWYGDDGE